MTASQLFTYYFVDLQVRHALAIHGYCWTRQGYIQHLEAVTMQKQCEKAKRQREREKEVDYTVIFHILDPMKFPLFFLILVSQKSRQIIKFNKLPRLLSLSV